MTYNFDELLAQESEEFRQEVEKLADEIRYRLINRKMVAHAAILFGLETYTWCEDLNAMALHHPDGPWWFSSTAWNPLTDDAQAFQLAVKLGIGFKSLENGIIQAGQLQVMVSDYDCELTAARHAIVGMASMIYNWEKKEKTNELH